MGGGLHAGTNWSTTQQLYVEKILGGHLVVQNLLEQLYQIYRVNSDTIAFFLGGCPTLLLGRCISSARPRYNTPGM